MKDKSKWYYSLPLTYKKSEIVCHKCGRQSIETTGSKDHKLYACVNNSCDIGFFTIRDKEV